MLVKRIFFLGMMFGFVSVHTKETDVKKVAQTRIGNLALLPSQQPGPLIGFGQNVIEKGDFQAFIYPDSWIGKHKNFTEVAPSILYGIRDDLSLFVEQSIAAHLALDGHHSAGFEDFLIQLEYAPYDHETLDKTKQVTIVTGLLLPFGSDRKEPPTGFGSPSFFLGMTASYLDQKWYCYISPAVLLTTKHGHNNKSGNQFLYQAGFGGNIAYRPNKWILTWMVELDGIYEQKGRNHGIVDQNSGGNVIILGPSLWFSTPRLILQAGVAPVISQHLFGNQSKNQVFIAGNIGWKFN